jgi:aldehyde dehydrogenase (NAD+)
VAFTGSTEVGKLIMEAAAKSNLKKVSLELGGKSPLVVFDDVDCKFNRIIFKMVKKNFFNFTVNEVVPVAVDGVFTNSGQICVAPSRTFVHENIYDEFVKRAVELAQKRKLGSQFEADVVQGPQVDKDTFDKVLQYIQYGIEDGAKLETGGKRWGTEGFFIEPTIFSNVTDNMRIARDEIFGPVMSILKFKSLEEVIVRANDTEYGLAAAVYSKNIENALAFANQVEAGAVRVNCASGGNGLPFGGYKQSGIGREGTVNKKLFF